MPRRLRKWKRTRVTTNLSGVNAATLEELSDDLGIPLGRVVDQALDDFFLKINVREGRTAPPYAVDHLQEAAARIRERLEQRIDEEAEGEGEEA